MRVVEPVTLQGHRFCGAFAKKPRWWSALDSLLDPLRGPDRRRAGKAAGSGTHPLRQPSSDAPIPFRRPGSSSVIPHRDHPGRGPGYGHLTVAVVNGIGQFPWHRKTPVDPSEPDRFTGMDSGKPAMSWVAGGLVIERIRPENHLPIPSSLASQTILVAQRGHPP